ncbi:MAG: SLC13 family permease, partial [Dialister sp.]|nr:SLC13 family permease [Dialister sp.]
MDATMSFYFSIFVFALTYLGIMSEKIPRSICALLGAGLVIYSGLLTQEMALQQFIDFNTLGLLAGMMVLIGVVKKSGFFESMALWAVKVSKGRPKELLIILGLITG